MAAVQTIIDRFGGVRKMARALDLGASTIQGWKQTGFVPSPRIPQIIAAGRAQGIDLAPADFFDPEAAAPTSEAA
ncbi:hypothetical protein EDC65_2271 [Stella humosa]|uniref:YdaS antitoxin of YdaST toxin-antitoxin system n=1 Tax=Stella humosa TaxID=94 RepID=A0A3N1M406_9PROT|nr:hypothetical protein [Stella humosa]ROQ00472.1 hypothetical protein EDC65_2271 [Stella humosa]BBK30283.1 hypothetical protein STHU_09170 [Stella humosa]